MHGVYIHQKKIFAVYLKRKLHWVSFCDLAVLAESTAASVGIVFNPPSSSSLQHPSAPADFTSWVFPQTPPPSVCIPTTAAQSRPPSSPVWTTISEPFPVPYIAVSSRLLSDRPFSGTKLILPCLYWNLFSGSDPYSSGSQPRVHSSHPA